MTPYEMYRSMFFTYIGRYGGFVGVNMVEPDYRVSKITIFWLAQNLAFMLAAVYTVCSYDLESMQKTSTYFGLVLQVGFSINHKILYIYIYCLCGWIYVWL